MIKKYNYKLENNSNALIRLFNDELRFLEIPNGITSINSYVFRDKKSLVNVTIPVSVIEIKNYAFINCSNLDTLIYLGTISQWESISKGEDWKSSKKDISLQCTDGTIII